MASPPYSVCSSRLGWVRLGWVRPGLLASRQLSRLGPVVSFVRDLRERVMTLGLLLSWSLGTLSGCPLHEALSTVGGLAGTRPQF